MSNRRMRGSYVAPARNMTALAAFVGAVTVLGGCADAGTADVVAQCVDRTAVPIVRVVDNLCPAGFGDSQPGQRYAWSYTELPEGNVQEDDDGYTGTVFAPVIIGDVGRPYQGGSYSKPRNFNAGRVALPPARVPVTAGQPPGTSTISRGGLGVTSSGSGSFAGGKGGSSGS